MWLPFRSRVTIATPLSPDEVEERLRRNSEQVRLTMRVRWPWDRGPSFHGEVGERRFKLIRAAFYSNTWRPVLLGGIRDSAQGSVVEVLFRLAHVVAVLMVVWLGAPTVMCIAIPVHELFIGRVGLQTLLVPLAAASFWAISLGAFELERRAALRALRDVLNADSRAEGDRRAA